MLLPFDIVAAAFLLTSQPASAGAFGQDLANRNGGKGSTPEPLVLSSLTGEESDVKVLEHRGADFGRPERRALQGGEKRDKTPRQQIGEARNAAGVARQGDDWRPAGGRCRQSQHVTHRGNILQTQNSG